MLHQVFNHYIGLVCELFCFSNEAVSEKAKFIALEFTLANNSGFPKKAAIKQEQAVNN